MYEALTLICMQKAPPRSCSIADYVSDVGAVADQLPHNPVVIGHSLGGFVVQKYLESHAAPAAVLIASAPPQGAGAGMLRTAASLLRVTTRHLWRTAKTTLAGESAPCFSEPDWVREMYFSPHTPESLVVRYAERVEREQIGRFALDMALLNLPKPDRVRTPMLVLGAQCDRSVTPGEVRATARAYRTQAEIFPNMGHDMMLEPGWAAVAERDGSTVVHIGPTQLDGVERDNWIQTMPGQGWFVGLRLYSPLDGFFDKTWRPSEVEAV